MIKIYTKVDLTHRSLFVLGNQIIGSEKTKNSIDGLELFQSHLSMCHGTVSYKRVCLYLVSAESSFGLVLLNGILGSFSVSTKIAINSGASTSLIMYSLIFFESVGIDSVVPGILRWFLAPP